MKSGILGLGKAPSVQYQVGARRRRNKNLKAGAFR
jgi:hypothetical protein